MTLVLGLNWSLSELVSPPCPLSEQGSWVTILRPASTVHRYWKWKMGTTASHQSYYLPSSSQRWRRAFLGYEVRTKRPKPKESQRIPFPEQPHTTIEDEEGSSNFRAALCYETLQSGGKWRYVCFIDVRTEAELTCSHHWKVSGTRLEPEAGVLCRWHQDPSPSRTLWTPATRPGSAVQPEGRAEAS